ncbi:MAG: 50S ribosomal protein L17 [Candidatus Zambryskibacteria bacterium RIFCSPHIGHO2_01_FULL_49_18]|uniref:50S ribosomal protein L17 n=2 Tax=Candidatus Zambryskiibacteriota TaxID=1817925 RepID=A0A1G2T299_9BACT|nr:MAG: 50S ribosomal protein L17 [Candidatus Zambryskibacteria bacterium RIFCSPHIGHO2_01_FULL_49_18]OHB05015.1 MAG: 50S ribosomal protein L17 [Candidatus Zambryskibacteria bacterium RIFCSPLOWO2_01_FULL_47_14]
MAYHGGHRKFGREKNQRVALMKSLAYSLALKGKIKTTEAKAKELRPLMEKLVTLGKKQTPASRRLLESRVGVQAARKIFVDLALTYKERAGGYTRITKMIHRKSDGAPQAVIEFV